tara:strand:- start:516 stop:857 length:342 start_codon:yes stop_codon:yes gene_type:complete
MKKNRIYSLIEYLSLTSILSYFFVNNIVFVFIGIIVSFYSINYKFINGLARSINKKFFVIKTPIDLTKFDNTIKQNSVNTQSKKEDYNLTLVEAIEELGYIPSIDENNDINAA